jgi:poly-gamma-glutamate synthesis protein (capsule biosynthesis protein)
LLKSAGFGVLSVANNHMQQHGRKVFRRCVELLAEKGLQAVGLADPKNPRACVPVDCEMRGVSLRFLAYSLRPRQFFRTQPEYAEPTPESLLEDVRAGVSASRTVIVSLHWGDEFIERPAPEQIDLGRRLIDAGATLIIGHHPHVLQPIERRGSGLIAYSLGNLVFDMLWEERLRRSGLLRCHLGNGKVLRSDFLPLVIDDDFSPRPASPEEGAAILARLDAGARALKTVPDEVSAPAVAATYRAEVAQELRRHRMASSRHFARNLLRYDPLVLASILSKAAMRRVGMRHD